MSVDRFYLHKDGKEMYNSSDLKKKNWKEGGLSIVFYLNKNGKKEVLSIVIHSKKPSMKEVCRSFFYLHKNGKEIYNFSNLKIKLEQRKVCRTLFF